jgi:hypothetical protein
MTDQLTNCIMLSALATEEVIRIDKEGFHYKGEFIADAGESHRLMVEFLNQNTPQPAPVAPSLKAQALEALERYEAEEWCEEMTFDSSIIRRALEALDD